MHLSSASWDLVVIFLERYIIIYKPLQDLSPEMSETPQTQREHPKQTVGVRTAPTANDADAGGEIRELLAHYLSMRGMQQATAEQLNEALQLVLDDMPAVLYGSSTEELTEHEQAVLRDGGVDLYAVTERDPIAETALQYAAIVKTSLTTGEVARRLGMPENQVRQMIARGTLYSFLLNNRRLIPIFQFERSGPLVANITKVNAALSPDLHPVEVQEWYTQADPDLFAGGETEAVMSPLAWLRSGGAVKKVVALAHRL
ncbi:MAG: helix-turn-helix domain-containing protein [Gammaproteobacteria bacterium]|nr:helix-turn-helix domain-containing protein [Gammaproteobacteria bacterium]